MLVIYYSPVSEVGHVGISMSPMFLIKFHDFGIPIVGITRVEVLQPVSKGDFKTRVCKESKEMTLPHLDLLTTQY